ncbi:hypothetical protein FRC00_010886, partial [Tulasnella sp. 408]
MSDFYYASASWRVTLLTLLDFRDGAAGTDRSGPLLSSNNSQSFTMTAQNSSVIFSCRPNEFPIPGQHLVVQKDATINLDSGPLNGGLLVKTIALSIDPYYRIMMDTTYKLGEPNTMQTLKKVSDLAESPVTLSGESFVQSLKITARGTIYTQRRLEYAVVAWDADQLRRIEKDAATWVQYIGILGMVTRTAWIGFYALAKAKKVGMHEPALTLEHDITDGA